MSEEEFTFDLALVERAKPGDIIVIRVPERFIEEGKVDRAIAIITAHLAMRGISGVSVVAAYEGWTLERLEAEKLAVLGYVRMQ